MQPASTSGNFCPDSILVDLQTPSSVNDLERRMTSSVPNSPAAWISHPLFSIPSPNSTIQKSFVTVVEPGQPFRLSIHNLTNTTISVSGQIDGHEMIQKEIGTSKSHVTNRKKRVFRGFEKNKKIYEFVFARTPVGDHASTSEQDNTQSTTDTVTSTSSDNNTSAIGTIVLQFYKSSLVQKQWKGDRKFKIEHARGSSSSSSGLGKHCPKISESDSKQMGVITKPGRVTRVKDSGTIRFYQSEKHPFRIVYIRYVDEVGYAQLRRDPAYNLPQISNNHFNLQPPRRSSSNGKQNTEVIKIEDERSSQSTATRSGSNDNNTFIDLTQDDEL